MMTLTQDQADLSVSGWTERMRLVRYRELFDWWNGTKGESMVRMHAHPNEHGLLTLEDWSRPGLRTVTFPTDHLSTDEIKARILLWA